MGGLAPQGGMYKKGRCAGTGAALVGGCACMCVAGQTDSRVVVLRCVAALLSMLCGLVTGLEALCSWLGGQPAF